MTPGSATPAISVQSGSQDSESLASGPRPRLFRESLGSGHAVDFNGESVVPQRRFAPANFLGKPIAFAIRQTDFRREWNTQGVHTQIRVKCSTLRSQGRCCDAMAEDSRDLSCKRSFKTPGPTQPSVVVGRFSSLIDQLRICAQTVPLSWSNIADPRQQRQRGCGLWQIEVVR